MWSEEQTIGLWKRLFYVLYNEYICFTQLSYCVLVISPNILSPSGLVLFIEEDHFLAEDFLHTLNVMQQTVRQTCSQCNILSLGTYLKTYNYYADAKKVRGVSRLCRGIGNWALVCT